MDNEQKVETTVGGLKEAFAQWAKDMEDDPEGFMSDDVMVALTPEKYGESATEYFLGILEQKDAPTTPKPR